MNIKEILLDFFPNDIVGEIFKYYDTKCNICNQIQKYCNNCEVYVCRCDNIMICNKCNDFSCICNPFIECNVCRCQQCSNNCNPLIKICECCNSYLCHTCWDT